MIDHGRKDDIDDIRVIIADEFDRIEQMLDELTTTVNRIDSRMNRQSTACDSNVLRPHVKSPDVP